MTEYWPDFTIDEMKLMLETLGSAIEDAPKSQLSSYKLMAAKLEDRILEARLDEYRTMFDEQFPRMLFQGVPCAELTELVEECLGSDRPYVPVLEPGVLY